MNAVTILSNSQTAGQTQNANQRMAGDSRRQTHSLFRSAKTLGTNSPHTIVTALSGMTTIAMAKNSARPGVTPRR